MATRTWNNSIGAFENAANWSPVGVPAAGDTAVINAGTVTASTALPSNLAIDLVNAGAGIPNFVFNNTGLQFGSSLLANSNSNRAVVQTVGSTFNGGGMTFIGGGSGGIAIKDTASGGVGTFMNGGVIAFVGALLPSIAYTGVSAAGGLINNGLIQLANSQSFTTAAIFNTPVAGTGQITVDSNDFLQFGGSVSSGQTIQFIPTATNAGVLIDNGATFQGTVAGFGASDRIQFTSAAWDTRTFSQTGDVETYTFTAAGNVVARITLKGAGYTDGNVSSTVSNTSNPGQTTTLLQTTVSTQPVRVAFTDAVSGVQGTDPGVPYSGPVAGLQFQYLWNSPDSAAIAGKVNNMFLKGNSGDDALSVTGGSNVLDGSTGSNFLVGGDGTDGGSDTFFVDGRGGGVTWSTIVHFHPGDQATIFGFTAQSTLPWTASDGVTGYTGATIHSELGGAGTGVNGSITFADINMDTASQFAFTTGNVGGNDYLLIQYLKPA